MIAEVDSERRRRATCSRIDLDPKSAEPVERPAHASPSQSRRSTSQWQSNRSATSEPQTSAVHTKRSDRIVTNCTTLDTGTATRSRATGRR
jgi:hypothetical protein